MTYKIDTDTIEAEMNKIVKNYLENCRKYCTSRISSDLFPKDQKQTNALRVENIRDLSDRCGEKPPIDWPETAKKYGWGRWVFSGGSPCVFGYCNHDCPLKSFFLRTAPRKIQKYAQTI